MLGVFFIAAHLYTVIMLGKLWDTVWNS